MHIWLPLGPSLLKACWSLCGPRLFDPFLILWPIGPFAPWPFAPPALWPLGPLVPWWCGVGCDGLALVVVVALVVVAAGWLVVVVVVLVVVVVVAWCWL